MNMTVTESSQNSQTAQRRSLPGYCLREESVLSVSTPFPASFLIISNTQHFLLDINSVAIDPGLFSYPKATAGLRTGSMKDIVKGPVCWHHGAKDSQLKH